MDNFYHSCPPMMSDGRHTSEHLTATRRNEHIKHVNKIYRDDEYRTFLQKNGTALMKQLWDSHTQDSKCRVNTNCIHNGQTRATIGDYITEMKAYNNRPNKGCTNMKDFTLH